MKVVFDASIRGKDLYPQNYQAIYDELQKIDCELASHTFSSSKEKIADESEEEASQFLENLESVLDSCDVGVFEVSFPSLGIGYEVGRLRDKSKPVLALHIKGQRPYVFEAMQDDKVFIIEYTLDTLAESIHDFFSIIKSQLNSRFTMLLDGKTRGILDKRVRQGESRSEYIRRLILEDEKRT